MPEEIGAADSERREFAERLAAALSDAGFERISCTATAREFNARSDLAPITVHAVRKWMVGEAIPTQGRLLVLANWLAVSPEWLRYGEVSATKVRDRDPDTYSLLLDIAKLDANDRVLMREFLNMLIHRVKI